MFTVALIGPDGAGKTTIAHRLENTLPLPVKYLYMGVSADSSNHQLITTRVVRAMKRACGAPLDNRGPRPHGEYSQRPAGVVRRTARGLKALLSLANRLTEEWFRQALACYYKRRRNIVVFDRHYFPDYYAYDIADPAEPRSLARRIHGYLLLHVYPKPDLFIYLDAPAEMLFARKGEGTLELLERRRGDYLELGQIVEHFEVVDAARPLDEVVDDVRVRVTAFYRNQFPASALAAAAADSVSD